MVRRTHSPCSRLARINTGSYLAGGLIIWGLGLGAGSGCQKLAPPDPGETLAAMAATGAAESGPAATPRVTRRIGFSGHTATLEMPVDFQADQRIAGFVRPDGAKLIYHLLPNQDVAQLAEEVAAKIERRAGGQFRQQPLELAGRQAVLQVNAGEANRNAVSQIFVPADIGVLCVAVSYPQPASPGESDDINDILMSLKFEGPMGDKAVRFPADR